MCVHIVQFYIFKTPRYTPRFDIVCLCVCLCVCVYSGYIMYHYNGIWGTCAPSGCNMHHQGAMCTMVHKGDHIFWKIQGPWWFFVFVVHLFVYILIIPGNLRVGSMSTSSCIFVYSLLPLIKQIAFHVHFPCTLENKSVQVLNSTVHWLVGIWHPQYLFFCHGVTKSLELFKIGHQNFGQIITQKSYQYE